MPPDSELIDGRHFSKRKNIVPFLKSVACCKWQRSIGFSSSIWAGVCLWLSWMVIVCWYYFDLFCMTAGLVLWHVEPVGTCCDISRISLIRLMSLLFDRCPASCSIVFWVSTIHAYVSIFWNPRKPLFIMSYLNFLCLKTSIGSLQCSQMESFPKLPIVVVRPNNIYGPRQFPEKRLGGVDGTMTKNTCLTLCPTNNKVYFCWSKIKFEKPICCNMSQHDC